MQVRVFTGSGTGIVGSYRYKNLHGSLTRVDVTAAVRMVFGHENGYIDCYSTTKDVLQPEIGWHLSLG